MLAKGMTQPLSRLATALERVQDGAAREPLSESGPRELASLATSFHAMTARLAEARAALQSAEREAAWRAALAPYFAEYGIDADAIPAGPGRAPFSAETAEVLEAFRPAVVSFQFGLPPADLLARVRAWGAKILGAATTVEEARWLEARGVDAIIVQGLV